MLKSLSVWLALSIILSFVLAEFSILDNQQFIYLANSFLNGSTSLIALPPSVADLSYFKGHFFWPLGPFPAILVSPFVLIFGLTFHQAIIQFPLNIANFILILKIAKNLNIPLVKSYFLASFYILGSIYTPVGAASISWYFAQVVATTLILLALLESQNKKRPLVVGFIIALAILTRFSFIFAIPFFLPAMLTKPMLRRLIFFSLPILLAVLASFAYNYQRFGNIFESGYNYQIISEQSQIRRSFGLFSPIHIPANLYYMLLKSPDPIFADNSHVLKPPFIRFDDYGMSIFILSPVLFLLIKTRINDPFVKRSIITVLFLLIPIITYYGIGNKQVGYRYALDFFPFLIFPLASAFQKTSETTIKLLVFLGIIITWFFTIERLGGF